MMEGMVVKKVQCFSTTPNCKKKCYESLLLVEWREVSHSGAGCDHFSRQDISATGGCRSWQITFRNGLSRQDLLNGVIPSGKKIVGIIPSAEITDGQGETVVSHRAISNVSHF